MGDYLASKGIVVQQTVPYAHEQNGKSERYIWTLEEGGQALLAGSGLPMSFWLDAVLTCQYLCNHLPTSTLHNDVTPFESITNGRKPNLSHLRVWGCDCYVAVLDELWAKAGFKRFRAIFVGYEEHRIGWHVCDLKGKYSFSNNVIFNEDLSGHLGVPCPLSSHVPSNSPPPHIHCNAPHTHTMAGEAYDEVLCLKEHCRVARESKRSSVGDDVARAVVAAVDGVVVVESCAVDGGVVDVGAVVESHAGMLTDPDVINDFISLLATSSFPDQVLTDSLELMEVDILWDHFSSSFSSPVSSSLSLFTPPRLPFNLSKELLSYAEAIACPDALAWRAAMDRERTSLDEMGAFKEVDLPIGEWTIGLKWVYAIKTDSAGTCIPGKEKARVVAQGFYQHPSQYDETYAPVAKLASVRILLAWAAVCDLEIYQFDCKTAFLHAKICHPIYARQIPGYPLPNSKKVLHILVALYGL